MTGLVSRVVGRLALLFAAVALLTGQPVAAEQPKRGGVINVAVVGEPPTLDPMASTADLVGIISQHIYETLYTFGEEWAVVPLLAAEMPGISDGGKVYTIPLRKGVRFHDGSTMTSNDVLASLKRWTQVAVRGRQAAALIESITATDEATIRIVLKEPYAPLLSLLSFNNSAAVIMPASVLAAEVSDIVGTGPYMLKDRQADRYMVLARFPGYVARPEPASMYGGNRVAYLDEIRFVPVADPTTRVEGTLSEIYDYADSLPVEAYNRFQQRPRVEAVLIKPFGSTSLFFNTKQGVLADPALRRAVQASLNCGDILQRGFGDVRFYEVDGALYPSGYQFHTKAGTDAYNKGDPALAQRMLQAAGYNGQRVRLLAGRQYEFHQKIAAAAAEYMKLAGLNVDLQVVEWATLLERRTDPKLWDIFVTHSPFLPEPLLNPVMSDSYPGWWSTPARNKLVAALSMETELSQRRAIFAELQRLVYDEVPMIKLGNFSTIAAKSKSLHGVHLVPWPFFWNVWRQN